MFKAGVRLSRPQDLFFVGCSIRKIRSKYLSTASRTTAPFPSPYVSEGFYQNQKERIIQKAQQTSQEMLGNEELDSLQAEKLHGNELLVVTGENMTQFQQTNSMMRYIEKKLQSGAIQAVNPTALDDIENLLCKQASSLAMVVNPKSLRREGPGDELDILAVVGTKQAEETEDGVKFVELGLSVASNGYGLVLSQLALQHLLPQVCEDVNVFYATISVTNCAAFSFVNKWSHDYKIAGIFEKPRGCGATASTQFVAVPVWGKFWSCSTNLGPRQVEEEVNKVVDHIRKDDIKRKGVNKNMRPLPDGSFTRDMLKVVLNEDLYLKRRWEDRKFDVVANWLQLPPKSHS